MNTEYIAEQFVHKGLTVKIIQDTDAFNPRKEYDNVGTMVCWHNRYDLGDEKPGRDRDPDEFLVWLAEEYREGLEDWLENGLWSKTVTADHTNEQLYKEQKRKYQELRQQTIGKILDKHYIMLPLRLYDHSGITMSVGSGAHPQDPGGWDSGQVGWIYCTKKKAVEEWGKKVCTKAVRAQAVKYLEGEVETYDQYLTGDVYGFVISDDDGDDAEELGSCWGHFGLDWAIQAAKENADDVADGRFDKVMTTAGDLPMKDKRDWSEIDLAGYMESVRMREPAAQ